MTRTLIPKQQLVELLADFGWNKTVASAALDEQVLEQLQKKFLAWFSGEECVGMDDEGDPIYLDRLIYDMIGEYVCSSWDGWKTNPRMAHLYLSSQTVRNINATRQSLSMRRLVCHYGIARYYSFAHSWLQHRRPRPPRRYSSSLVRYYPTIHLRVCGCDYLVR